MVNKKTKNQTFIVVDFLDIDTKKITLNNPKPNNYGGSYAPLRYDDKILYVRYDARISPFGLSTNKDKKGEITGYSTSISLKKNDPYFIKAREIDDFFIDKCIENSVLWGLGGSKTEKVDVHSIIGYDDKGEKGKWKRILKYTYKINKIGVLAMWGSVALGTWGASIKPKAQQIRVFENKNLVVDECLLECDDDDDVIPLPLAL